MPARQGYEGRRSDVLLRLLDGQGRAARGDAARRGGSRLPRICVNTISPAMVETPAYEPSVPKAPDHAQADWEAEV